MLRALILLALSCLLSPAFADERAQTQQQLDATRQDIAELKKTLSKLQEEKAGVQKDLKTTETDIGNLEKQVEALQQELKKTEGELERLDTEKKKLQSARVEQQRLIAIQARSAYQNNGREEYLKLLLNQQNPEKFARTLTYYDYLSKARLEQLRTFNETLRQLANVEQEISSQQQQLLAQRADLDSRRQELETERAKRQQVLAKLNSDVKDRGQKLQAREQDQADLAKVLKTIEETLARQAREAEEARKKALLAQQEAEKRRKQEALAAAAARDQAREPAEPPKKARTTLGPMVSSDGANYGGAFSAARGKLPWPVNGRLLARFGDARGSDARAKWDGVMISATPGTQVRAVHGGRVVFADWLRGAGLLVILDHGNGYLSLYGHNQSLLKNAGDIVKAGEAISTVGNSGGQEAAGLYFAIRQQGRPTDPSQWCRG
ncbi:peptidoglycan DD-metalloendopeptidase family protein [Pseudomonas putida]|jgi:septal ring factor EnvC (AmiA/AmiB activator)|uniref:Peptidase M23 n=1 Tax=Pseudomonas monteilii TaxID=76759 RepID=A0A2N1IR95_9PSED|nr:MULTISPECIES: peptidoglycan DD-metalloendopeptidase family protein [Pseudomonas]EKT4456541.1 peptidoglycan DD-metalloendopeptidase family protein [Pseudomonas putida]EKT4472164.1 peptidoglycan DD-metalloendopeptidase family protein [Pseudomonas putida]EKT4494815.1 peptidoglycan DD-metalloendopeptidase family protein [Pseudomonas putida]EKT4515072.1 peptidoglycan DD-metalloendopeptidase family protein [Pseudomonas putida]EKT4531473.1 peptidoglycan DD-metalloendopeptidase family protein [Pseu